MSDKVKRIRALWQHLTKLSDSDGLVFVTVKELSSEMFYSYGIISDYIRVLERIGYVRREGNGIIRVIVPFATNVRIRKVVTTA